jgi:hypothetical protein
LAVAPILGYVLLALLWDEYARLDKACLTATRVRTATADSLRERIEIQNCGSVPLRDIEWEFPAEETGWVLIDKNIPQPWPVLEPGEKITLPIVTMMGSESQMRSLYGVT